MSIDFPWGYFVTFKLRRRYHYTHLKSQYMIKRAVQSPFRDQTLVLRAERVSDWLVTGDPRHAQHGPDGDQLVLVIGGGGCAGSGHDPSLGGTRGQGDDLLTPALCLSSPLLQPPLICLLPLLYTPYDVPKSANEISRKLVVFDRKLVEATPHFVIFRVCIRKRQSNNVKI